MMLLFDMMTIGNRLLAARKRLGMTQAEVAERAGLSDRTYADIERGGVMLTTGFSSFSTSARTRL